MDTLDFVSKCVMVVRVGRRSDLVLAGAYAGTDGCVVTQIPLDVRGYHMSVNTISGDKPLACDLPGSHGVEGRSKTALLGDGRMNPAVDAFPEERSSKRPCGGGNPGGMKMR